jgi:hypothetical protein
MVTVARSGIELPCLDSAFHNSPAASTEPRGLRSVFTVAVEGTAGRRGRRFLRRAETNSLNRPNQTILVLLVPLRGSVTHRHLALQRNRFLVVGIDRNRTQRVFARFAAVAAFEKDSAEQYVRVD